MGIIKYMFVVKTRLLFISSSLPPHLLSAPLPSSSLLSSASSPPLLSPFLSSPLSSCLFSHLLSSPLLFSFLSFSCLPYPFSHLLSSPLISSLLPSPPPLSPLLLFSSPGLSLMLSSLFFCSRAIPTRKFLSRTSFDHMYVLLELYHMYVSRTVHNLF